MKADLKAVLERRSNAALEPLIRHARQARGNMADIHQRFCRATKCKVARTAVERWLAEDPSKRTQPMLGAALVLLDIAKELGL